MSSLISKYKFLILIIFTLLTFLGFYGISRAQNNNCQILGSTSTRPPSSYINDYSSDYTFVYVDIETLDCNSDSPNYILMAIETAGVSMVQPLPVIFAMGTQNTSNWGPENSVIKVVESDFTLPMLLGDYGCPNVCSIYLTFFVIGDLNQLQSILNNQNFDYSNPVLSLGSSDSALWTYAEDSGNDPHRIGGSWCNPSETVFVLPYGETCDLNNTTLNIVTASSPSSGEAITISEEPLAPLPGFDSNPDLGGFFKSLFTFLIVIAGLLAFIMIVRGGITYLTADSFGQKGNGKEYIWNAIIGLVLALGAWVILNTINPDLASDLNIAIPQVSLDGPTKEWNNGNAAAGANIAPSALLSGQPILMGMPWPDDSQQRSQLSAAGISVVSSGNSNCTPTAGTPNCTSVYFDGPAAGVIQEIINFRNTCGGCEIVITGGSEAWLHRTHGPNKRIVDMRATPSLNAYLNGLPDGPPPGENFPSGKTIDIEGVGRFYAEPHGSTSNTTNKHWHVTIY
jgi:hypothetical protein